MKSITRFFWLCSGSSFIIINRHPTEGSKYAGIGATIFFTGIFAALSATYAFYTVFDNYLIAVGSGLLWGAMIFNLDRYIVSSMRKRASTKSELLMATPRIILAVLIAMVISKPLELKIFEKEIDNELVLVQQEMRKAQEASILDRYNGQIGLLNNEITGLKSEITDKENTRNLLSDEAVKEADGTGGTMRRNAGPIYKLKKAEADRAEEELSVLREYNETLIAQKQAGIDSIYQTIATEYATLGSTAFNGFASRLDALDRITSKSSAIFLAHLFIVLLFIAIECAPIFVKLISTKGPYDDRLQVHEHLSHTSRTKNMATENSRTKEDTKQLGSPESDWVESELAKSLR